MFEMEKPSIVVTLPNVILRGFQFLGLSLATFFLVVLFGGKNYVVVGVTTNIVVLCLILVRSVVAFDMLANNENHNHDFVAVLPVMIGNVMFLFEEAIMTNAWPMMVRISYGIVFFLLGVISVLIVPRHETNCEKAKGRRIFSFAIYVATIVWTSVIYSIFQ